MALLSTETWSRIKTIAGALAAIGGLAWSIIVYAESKIDEKIELQNEKTSVTLNRGFTSIERQLLMVEERLIRTEIKELLRGKTLSELDSDEVALWEELKSDHEIIKNAKRKLDKLIENEKPN